MVAALRPVLVEFDIEGCEHLIEAAITLWVADARRYLFDGDVLTGELARRCEQAWMLILRRPPGVALVDLAASMAGVDPGEVWRLLEDAVLGG